jgi:DNA (cytosine-5)-methyltransferase 1
MVSGGKKQGIQDLKERGVLLFGSMDYVKTKTPKVFVLENVLNLLHGFRAEFDELVTMLEDIGYETFWDVINSYDCNLPQSRARVYLVGIFGGCAPGRKFTFPTKLQHRVDLQACLDSLTFSPCAADDTGPDLPARCLKKIARAMHEAKTDPLNSHSIP